MTQRDVAWAFVRGVLDLAFLIVLVVVLAALESLL